MAEATEVNLRNAPVSVVPRGMVNPQNACYINCVLQCLVHCPPLYHYIAEHVRPLRLPPPTTSNVASSSTGPCPVLRAMVQLFSEFPPCPPGSAERLRPGRPFSPHYVWSVLRQQQPPGAQGATGMSVNSQEDAQEFLGFLLDSLHTELSQLEDTAATEKKGKPRSKGGGDWAEVRKGNKATVVTEVSERRSAISTIFHGVLGSHVSRTGAQATVTKQPFSVLPLEVHSPAVATVEDALAQLTVRAEVESRSAAQHVHTNILIESAPPVLVLYLKRWVYESTGAARKVEKSVGFDQLLNLNARVFPLGKPQDRRYRLTGVIVHVGTTAYAGHYVSYVPLYDHAKDGAVPWLMLSDTRCTAVTWREVQAQPAYLLLYVRDAAAALPKAPAPPPTLIAAGCPAPMAGAAAPSAAKGTVGPKEAAGPRLEAAQAAKLAARRLAKLRPKLGVVVEDRTVAGAGPRAEAGPRRKQLAVTTVKWEGHLLRLGDVVAAMDGEPVENQTSFHERVNGLQPGDEILLDVVRAGAPLQFRCRVGCQVAEAEADFLRRVVQGEWEEADSDRLHALLTGEAHVLWGITAVSATSVSGPAAAAPAAEEAGLDDKAPDGVTATTTSTAAARRKGHRRNKGADGL